MAGKISDGALLLIVAKCFWQSRHSCSFIVLPSGTLCKEKPSSQNSQVKSTAQLSSQGNKLSIESLLDDLEKNSPVKPARKPPPPKHGGTFKFKRKSDINTAQPTADSSRAAVYSQLKSENLPTSQQVSRSLTSHSQRQQQGTVSEEERIKQIIEQKRLAALAKRKQSKLNWLSLTLHTSHVNYPCRFICCDDGMLRIKWSLKEVQLLSRACLPMFFTPNILYINISLWS